jgi:GNAT superfamily N-acetyltransferase
MSITGPRGARAEEIPDVVELANRVFRPDGEASMGEEYPLLYAPENAGNLRLFLEEERPVSLVGMVERPVSLLGTRHMCCEIGSVCTHPDYRGRGLATRLLENARRRALGHGCDLFLISGGRGLYRRQGYVDAGQYVHITVTAGSLSASQTVDIRPSGTGDLGSLVDLHSAEPVRFVRPPEDFRALLDGGCTLNGQADTWLVETSTNRPAAYVLCRSPGSRGVKEGELWIDELAGSRLAVARALPALLNEYEANEAHIEGLAADLELIEVARARDWQVESRGFHGTVGIIDPRRFWNGIQPLIGERLGKRARDLHLSADDGRVNLSFGNERIVLPEMADFTRLVFLPSEQRDPLQVDLTDDARPRGILDRLFPLPLVSYGLNYV